MVNYRIVVQNATGTKLGEFDTFKNLKINKRLNNYGTCSFDIPVNDPKADSLVALRLYTVWIYREDDDGSLLIWAGEMASRSGSLTSDTNNWVTINCFDWLEILNSRFTVYEKIYDNEDAGAIAQDLIETTNADGSYGDTGITIGTIEATVNRDREYHNQNIMQAIIDLSSIELGFDFEITNNRVLNIKSLIGEDKTDSVVFEYGHNIASGTILEDFSKITNRSIVLGEAIGETDLQRVEVDDTVSQPLYKLREQQVSMMEQSELSTFTEKGQAVNAKYGAPLFTIDITIKKSSSPSIADFSIGDSVRVKIKNGIYDIDEDFRVFEWSVTYGTDNSEQLSVVLGNFRV